MATTLPHLDRSAPLLTSDIRPRPAKAHLRKAEEGEWRARVGGAVERAYKLCGWSLKEFASKVRRDERQLARWISGAERPQFDVMFGVEVVRSALVIALAELAGAGVQVETTVTIRRIA